MHPDGSLDWPELLKAAAIFVAAVAAALVSIIPIVVTNYLKLRDTNHRIDEIWNATERQGRVEVDKKHVANINENGEVSGRLKLRLRKALSPKAKELKDLYAANMDKTDGQLTELISTQFGEWLTDYICVIVGVEKGACLNAALRYAKYGEEWPSDPKDSAVLQKA